MKKSIIDQISSRLDSIDVLALKSGNVYVEFRDYKQYNYVTTTGYGTVGFMAVRRNSCNRYTDSICVPIRTVWNNQIWGYDMSILDSINSFWRSRICVNNTLQVCSRVINKPVDDWYALENEFFIRKILFTDPGDDYKSDIEMIFPVRFFVNDKSRAAYDIFVKVSFVGKKTFTSFSISKKAL